MTRFKLRVSSLLATEDRYPVWREWVVDTTGGRAALHKCSTAELFPPFSTSFTRVSLAYLVKERLAIRVTLARKRRLFSMHLIGMDSTGTVTCGTEGFYSPASLRIVL